MRILGIVSLSRYIFKNVYRFWVAPSNIKYNGTKPTCRLPENMALPQGMCNPNARRALVEVPRANPRLPPIQEPPPEDDRSTDEDPDPDSDEYREQPLEDTSSCCTDVSELGRFSEDMPASSSKD